MSSDRKQRHPILQSAREIGKRPMSNSEQHSKRQRLSLGLKQRAHLLPHEKGARNSIATSSPSKSKTYAQKTASSNQKTSNSYPDQESNISVYVRCRSLNEREIQENTGKVVLTKGHMKREVVLRTTREKTYTFDRVFGPESDQEMVYEGIAKGLLQEMLQGYNCTVFAYGQTGTGKTYTMSGDIAMASNRIPDDAGIIPRTLVDLFSMLEKTTEFTVKVSFIELYNEDLRDLLLTNESEERKVKIFDDQEKKSIVIQGMEEIFIKTAHEGMEVLKTGSHNRQVAATKCNDLSSRSHSVFTITVHMKEIDPISGEEYLKVGKLNLVDLAGSENISRSGAENKRAREAGMINQSLLTLGRVINALVDQAPHIPYRESKLTRLLQDSLGGKTKTCIIATISPAKISLDETISTLEYANRAKNIKNKPQLNQTMSKKMLIKEYIQEIERLRNDLNATRNRNGVYVSDENWEKINTDNENKKIQVEDQKLRIDVLEEKIRKSKLDYENRIEYIKSIEAQFEQAREERMLANQKLQLSLEKLHFVERDLQIESLVNKNHTETETQLTNAHQLLKTTLDEVLLFKSALHDTIDKKCNLEAQNMMELESGKVQIISRTETMAENVARLYNDNETLNTALTDGFQLIVDAQQSKIQKKCNDIAELGEKVSGKTSSLLEILFEKTKSMSEGVDGIRAVKQEIDDSVTSEVYSLKREIMSMADDINAKIEAIKGMINSDADLLKTRVNDDRLLMEKWYHEQNEEMVERSERDRLQYLEMQRKFETEIEDLKRWKQAEDQIRLDEQDDLIKQVTSLIHGHDAKRQKRFDDKLQAITPALGNLVEEQSLISTNFKRYMDGYWAEQRQVLLSQLHVQAKSMEKEIDKRLHLNLTPVNQAVIEILEKQTESFEGLITGLHTKTKSLDEYIASVKQLIDEGYMLTSEQLRKVEAIVQDALQKIQSSFKKYGRALSECKPQVVDAFVSKQQSFMGSYRDTTLAELKCLEEFVEGITYSQDDEPVPLRQKVDVPSELPRSLPRHEIIRIHQGELEKKIPLMDVDPNTLATQPKT